MKTIVVNSDTISHDWFVVDAANKVLGRLASTVAQILIGKDKVAYSPNQDHGDNIIVVNSDKVKLTGKKTELKTYFSHSTYPGGKLERPFKKQMQLDSTQVIIRAVRGMVPKNKLGRDIMRKLHVYKTAAHPHASQKPKELSI
ncbi:MAG TPA: 50S ribosomal protein L13 [Chitinivibrionales bacterium]|nr:50S ribosomal protein L13 [Chitinivibrionales bacterium]